MRIHALHLFCIGALVSNGSFAGTVTEQELTKTPWQFGLVGNARSMPVELAFRSGVTAAVLRLLPNGQARVETPCRNDEFIKKIGEDLVYIGTWKLQADELSYEVSFRGHAQKESGLVHIQGDEMQFIQGNGAARRLGRFYGNVNDPCLYR